MHTIQGSKQAQVLLNENMSRNSKATMALGKIIMDARTKVMEDIAADELVKELPIDNPECVAHMHHCLEEQRLLRKIRIARLKRLKASEEEERPVPSSPHRSSSPSNLVPSSIPSSLATTLVEVQVEENKEDEATPDVEHQSLNVQDVFERLFPSNY